MSVRPFRPADAAGAVAVLDAVVPYLVTTPAAFAWQLALGDAAPERQRVWVATAGERIVGLVRGDGVDYETWRSRAWDRPDMDHALTTVVTVDGAVAGYSLAQTDGRDRYWSAMTGVLRAFRGRGLAKVAKVDSLGRARDAGYRVAYTANDETNAPMLAVNRWLGYRPAATQWRYDKAL